MVYNLISRNSYGQFNIELAKKLGLQAAVYISCIADICTQVDKKNAYDQNTGIWTLKREYVEEQTTLTEDEQIECENVFIKLGAIERVKCKKNNQLIVKLNIVEDLIVGRVPVPEDVFYMPSVKTKMTKQEAIILGMKKVIREQDPELRQAYYDWVEVAYNKGVCNKTQALAFEDDVNKLASTKEKKLEIISTCMKAGYKVAEWALNKNKNVYATTATYYSHLSTQQISDGDVNRNEGF